MTAFKERSGIIAVITLCTALVMLSATVVANIADCFVTWTFSPFSLFAYVALIRLYVLIGLVIGTIVVLNDN